MTQEKWPRRLRNAVIISETAMLWSLGIYLTFQFDLAKTFLAAAAATSILGMVSYSRAGVASLAGAQLVATVKILGVVLASVLAVTLVYQNWSGLSARVRSADLEIDIERGLVVVDWKGGVPCVRLSNAPADGQQIIVDVKHGSDVIRVPALRCGESGSAALLLGLSPPASFLIEADAQKYGVSRLVVRDGYWYVDWLTCRRCEQGVNVGAFAPDSFATRVLRAIPGNQLLYVIFIVTVSAGLLYGVVVFSLMRIVHAAVQLGARPIHVLRRFPAVWYGRQFGRSVFAAPEVLPGLSAKSMFLTDDPGELGSAVGNVTLRLVCIAAALIFKMSGVLMYPLVFLSTALRLNARVLEDEVNARKSLDNPTWVLLMLVAIVQLGKVLMFFSTHQVSPEMIDALSVRVFTNSDVLQVGNALLLITSLVTCRASGIGASLRWSSLLVRLSLLVSCVHFLVQLSLNIDFLAPLVSGWADAIAFDLCRIFSQHPSCWR